MAKKIDPITGELIEEDGFEQEFFGDIDQDESGGIQQGPTPEMPFKFTEQALNPRAQAVSGVAQRDPRARSAFTGLAPGFGQTQMSEEDQQFAMGKAFGLNKKEIREVIEGQVVLPMGIKGKNLAQIEEAKAEKLQEKSAANELGSSVARSNPILSNLMSASRGRGVESPDATSDRTNRMAGEMGQQFARFGDETNKPQQGDPDDRGGSSRENIGMSMLFMGLSPEQRVFRTFMAMDPKAQAKVDFKDERFVHAMYKMGNNSAAEFSKFGGMDAGDQRDWIQEKQSSKSGGNLMSRIGKAVTLTGVAALTGGAIGGMLAAPLAAGGFGLGSTAAGAFGGAAGGFTSAGMNQLIAGQFNPQGLATSTVLGAAGGAIGGHFAGAGEAGQSVEAANLAPQVSQAQGGLGGAVQSVKNFAKPVTDFLSTPGGSVLQSAAKGGIGVGIGEIAGGDVPEFKSEGGTGLSSDMFSAQSQGIGGQSRFQRKPDDPFYQAPTDLESAQGDLV